MEIRWEPPEIFGIFLA